MVANLLSQNPIGGLLSQFIRPASALPMAGNGFPRGGPFPMAPAHGPGGGIMQNLMGQRPTSAQAPGSSFGSGLRDLLSPEIALPMAAGLLTGRTNAEGFGNAFAALGDARKGNRTKKFLEQRYPEIAQMVDAGLSPSDAFKLAMDERRIEAQTAKGSQVDEYGFPVSGSMSQKLRALEMQGLDRQTALGIASGRYEMSINPMTGERALIDVATQSMVPLKSGQMSEGEGASPYSSGELPSGKTLYEMADDATGVAASVKRGASNTLGQLPGAVGEMFTSPDAVEAGQEFELFKRDLIRSLSLNPRFPVAEMERIANLVPTGAGVASSTTKVSLESLSRELARIEAEAQASANDAKTPIEQRQADMQTLRSVRAARARLGVPDRGGGSGAGSGRTSSGLQWSVGE